jgi:hypothetical protein
MAIGLVAQTMKVKEAYFLPGALDLAEQAIHLLRRSRSALADYFIGSLPFTLGLLFFWSDMSRNAYAAGYCAPAAIGLAALFIWMKLWQARFCRQLWCVLNGTPAEAWHHHRCWGVAARQAALHAVGLVMLAIAAVIVLPFGWVYAFYQNVSVLESPGTRRLRHLYREAVDQTVLWPLQNHLLLAILLLFGLFVMLNAAAGLIMLPYLLKWLLGIETRFTISGLYAMTNTTFLAIVGVLTYLCVDPIIKAAYTLRCFYGRSRHSGDDLRAAVKSFSVTVVLLAMVMTVAAPHAWAAMPGTVHAANDTQLSQADGYARRLDESIQRVLQQRRFAWRMPREKTPGAPKQNGWLVRSIRWLCDGIAAVFEAIDRWVESVAEWLNKHFSSTSGNPTGGTDWRAVVRLVFYGLGAALVLLILWGLRRWLTRRRAAGLSSAPSRREPVVDINDEAVTANDLPSDRWLALAQELAGRGDFPQALRALYLGVLAQLGDLGRVRIARYKSNRDYLNELARRTHAEPELYETFDQCVTIFERVWYGTHPVGEALLTRFRADQERIARLVRHPA